MEDEYTLAKDLGYTGPTDWLRSEYWGNGRSSADIAEDIGVTKETILNWLHRHKVPVRPRGGRNAKPGYSKCLAALRKIPNLEQYTAQQLAEMTGFCRSTIHYAAARYGLKIAKRNPPIIHRLQRLDTQDLTMEEIRNLLPEYHPATIRTALYRAGMSWRKRGQR